MGRVVDAIRRNRHAIAYIILTIGVAVALLAGRVNDDHIHDTADEAAAAADTANAAAILANTAAHAACDNANQVRVDLVATIDDLLRESYTAMIAVRDDPEATDADRWAAVMGFVRAERRAETMRRHLAPKECPPLQVPDTPTFPKVVPPTSSTTSARASPSTSSSPRPRSPAPGGVTATSTTVARTRSPVRPTTTTTACAQRGRSGKCHRS